MVVLGASTSAKPGRSRRSWCAALTASLLLALVLDLRSQTSGVPEYQVKATFLYQFLEFAEWPQHAMPAPGAPVSVCVLGADPFGSALDEIVQSETVRNHPIEIVRFKRIEEMKTCHVLFVAASEAAQTEKIASAAAGRHTLTVGDTGDFADRGGMIQFVTMDRRIRLRINPGAARAAGIVVSSKLLRQATIVNTPN